LVESDDFSAKADFRVLGTLAASVNGHPVRLGGPRQIAVLAMLITSRGAVVPADRLASEAWENLRPPTPTTLHVYVSKLRKALEPERLTRAPGRLLTREGSGYALRIDPSQVDSERFTELALKGRQALEDQRFEEAHALLTKSLKLWRGPAYADVADMSFALPEIARLTELHVTAREDSLAALIELGRHDIAVGSLDALVSEQPLRERAWELLCLALYRSGRQADALAALRTIRQRLAEDLGIDPSPTLRDLEAAILEQDPALDKPKLLRTSAYVTPTGSERGKKPPSPLTRLIGRADELGSVQDLLAEHRMVTLVGPGGVGKTRLALELTRMRCDPEGPFYVDLLAISTPDLLVSTLVEALGVPGATCFEQMAAALDGQKALLVLDNCEHLLPDIAVYASRMLGSLEGLRVLATSREPLGLVGEAVFDVQPLDPQTDGAELFQQRAAAVLPTWHPQEAEVASIQRICDELDGIPLAIELAAAQCRLLSVEEIQHALDDRFSLLIGGEAAGRRHRALHDTISWSYQLLSPGERQLFHALGVFAGPFNFEAARAVSACESLLPTLAALVRKSLVAVVPATSPRRYRLLESLRQYALRQASEQELSDAQERHMRWVLEQAERADRMLRSPQAAVALAELDALRPEIRTAMDVSLHSRQTEVALRLGSFLSWYWYRMGHLAEGLRWLTEALDTADSVPAGLLGQALVGRSALLYLAGDPAGAYQDACEAAEKAALAGDLSTQARALGYRTHFGVLAGAEFDADQAAVRAVELAERCGEDWIKAEVLMIHGMLCRAAGNLRKAADLLHESIDVAERCGHSWAAQSATWCALKTALDTGDARHALVLARDIVADFERCGDVTSWLASTHSAAAALVALGYPDQAALLMGAVEGHGRRVGYSPASMDPVDGPREQAAVREALPPARYAELLRQGHCLSRREIGEILADVLSKSSS
jgi:predicted ATPase/DNA-binding SARP family transcriptional activator